jgi:hypothetical protein
VHQIHHDINAPPDAPSDPGTSMTPEMMAEQHVATVRGLHAKAAVDEVKAAHAGRQAVHEMHKTIGTIAGTHATVVNTNRLMQTPIPEPAEPGGA